MISSFWKKPSAHVSKVHVVYFSRKLLYERIVDKMYKRTSRPQEQHAKGLTVYWSSWIKTPVSFWEAEKAKQKKGLDSNVSSNIKKLLTSSVASTRWSFALLHMRNYIFVSDFFVVTKFTFDKSIGTACLMFLNFACKSEIIVTSD